MKIISVCLLSILYVKCSGQSFKEYLPSMICTLVGGASDGVRDASLFYRMQGTGKFWDGSQSWKNKYENGNIAQGSAYVGSNSYLAFTTDAPHMMNFVTHQATGMAMAFLPTDNNKKFFHVLLKVAAYNAIRQVGHYALYDIAFKPK